MLLYKGYEPVYSKNNSSFVATVRQLECFNIIA